jgi:8-oxo-dGTP pyrophosphatase MutT (NUDIX family)
MVSDHNVRLAVCMALFDSDDKLLMTRRSSHLNSFPRAWVMPGGHIELGESLEVGGIRELSEETGVTIDIKTDNNGKECYIHDGEECVLEPFYVFESCSKISPDY